MTVTRTLHYSTLIHDSDTYIIHYSKHIIRRTLLVTITQFPEPARGQLWKIPRLTTTPSIRSCPCPTPPCTLMRHPNGLCGGKALGSWTLEDTLMDHSDVGVFAYAKTWPRRRITCRYVSAGSLCRSSGWYYLVRLPGVDF